MKRLITLIVLLTFSAATYAQVARNYVVVEIATGTWCYYCPGAAMGADDLHDNGDPVAIVENHNGDPFAHADSDARNSYYGVSGYPTANFDGKYDEYVGGSNTASMYSNYKPIVDTRILMSSSHVMEIYGESVGDDYTITVRIQKQAPYESDDLKVRIALTESHIPYNWQGMDEVNFVNRLMAPDADGIDITDINDYEIHDITFTFEFDNTWDIDECELVTFIQDDENKFILNSTKVLMNDLEAAPDMLSASFTASEEGICESGTVDYTPDATGTGNLYQWTFEGGTPTSSTEESPSVYYDAVGDYNVGLIVTDGVFVDTNMVYDFMSVVNPVATPAEPAGETEICSGFLYNYDVPELDYAWEYEWELYPADAGTLTWDMNEATLDPASDWTGDFTLKVRASNICGESEWSDELEASLYTSPAEYELDGGGTYCVGGDGLELTLSGSESGVDYELYLDGTSTGQILAGTGSGLSFGLQTDEGYYTVNGFTVNCDVQMMGQEQIYITYPPLECGIPEGPDAVCNNEVTQYETEGNVEADYYLWTISPEDAGTIEGTGLTAIVTWNDTFEGDAEIVVTGANTCGEGNPSEEFMVNVDDTPAPYVDGEPLVCDNHSETYEAEHHEGSTYTWEVTGGEITEGQGTYSVTIAWGEPGEGSVTVSEETANGCPGSSSSYPVTIDDCTGIGDNVANSLSIHPNPAKEFVNIKANDKLMNVMVFSLTGEMMINSDVDGQEIRLNTTDFKSGLYLIKITTESGVTSKRLIIE